MGQIFREGYLGVSYQDAGAEDTAYVFIKEQVTTWKGETQALRICTGRCSVMLGVQRSPELVDDTSSEMARLELMQSELYLLN